jgi:lipoprotein-anchoring transpeptidase ErfK/SrfK
MDKKASIAAVIVVVAIAATAATWRVLAPPSRISASSSAETVMQKFTSDTPKAQSELSAIIKQAGETISREPDSPKAENAYLAMAEAYENAQELVKAKESYKRFMEKFPASKNILKAQESLENLNVRILFSPEKTAGTALYEVRKGDNLTKIAKKFNTTVELLARSNNIEPGAVRTGAKIKVPTVKFSIVVDKSQNILTLKADGDIFKTYRVATGKTSSPTPAGTFKITDKIIDPPWYPPGRKMIPSGDPQNVLGSRWLGISKPSYGIHGTVDPSSIGKNVTDGCVRLKNPDVEELYAIVPDGTEVVIVD